MARRMGCDQSLVLKWESNYQEPDPGVIRQYISLRSFVEEHAERTRQMPLAESLLKDEQLSQCSQEEVIAWESLASFEPEGDGSDSE